MAWVEQRGNGYRVRYRLPDKTICTEHGFADFDEAENRALDIESDQRRNQFIDPRLAQTTVDQWIRTWLQAQRVSGNTWQTYDSHIRNHILPQWTDSELGEISRIRAKS
jgi:hypothetical protein